MMSVSCSIVQAAPLINCSQSTKAHSTHHNNTALQTTPHRIIAQLFISRLRNTKTIRRHDAEPKKSWIRFPNDTDVGNLFHRYDER